MQNMSPSRRLPGSTRSSERTMTAGEAARALGISVDTLRRWDREGRIRTTRDNANRRRVPAREVERLSGRAPRVLTGSRLSARNRLSGVVRSVESDVVMALVEIEAGPYLLAAAITRDAVEELALAPGVPVVVFFKATGDLRSRQAFAGQPP